MAFKIGASSLFTKRYLKVDSAGVEFMETAGLGGKRRFSFGQIGCILMSPDHKLSFQVGREVFSIPTKPYKQGHQETIKALVQSVRAAAPAPGPT